MDVNEEDAAVIQILLDADDDAEAEESAPLQATAKSPAPGPSIDIRDAVFINLDIGDDEWFTSAKQRFDSVFDGFGARFAKLWGVDRYEQELGPRALQLFEEIFKLEKSRELSLQPKEDSDKKRKKK